MYSSTVLGSVNIQGLRLRVLAIIIDQPHMFSYLCRLALAS
jgi:hypothetical protein